MTTSTLILPDRKQSRANADRANRKPRCWGLVTIALLLLTLGGGLLTKSALIHGKAWLGPILLRQAWAGTLASTQPTKPWSWADIEASARLTVPALGIDLIVLNNSSGEALTWGPGFWTDPAIKPADRLTILTGHRDTHFAFLSDIKPGVRFQLETIDHTQHEYVAKTIQVVDVRYDQITKPATGDWLLLITCHPFDSVRPYPPERYLVWAQKITN